MDENLQIVGGFRKSWHCTQHWNATANFSVCFFVNILKSTAFILMLNETLKCWLKCNTFFSYEKKIFEFGFIYSSLQCDDLMSNDKVQRCIIPESHHQQSVFVIVDAVSFCLRFWINDSWTNFMWVIYENGNAKYLRHELTHENKKIVIIFSN